MFTMYSLHVHYILTICSLYIHYMFTICSLYMFTTYIFTICSLYTHYIFTICSLYIHHMFTIYSLYVHYILTIQYKLQRTLHPVTPAVELSRTIFNHCSDFLNHCKLWLEIPGGHSTTKHSEGGAGSRV